MNKLEHLPEWASEAAGRAEAATEGPWEEEHFGRYPADVPQLCKALDRAIEALNLIRTETDGDGLAAILAAIAIGEIEEMGGGGR